MLVVSRKKNESIVINDDITIVVVEIRGDNVRLGIEAPREVSVHRREVYDAIRRNQYSNDDEIGNRSYRSTERLQNKSAQPASPSNKQAVAAEARPSSESPQWQELVGRGFRAVQGWFNKLVDMTVPTITETSLEKSASEAPALEPRELIFLEAVADAPVQATDGDATEARTLETNAIPAAKKRSPRKATATQATVKKATKKASPKKAAVKKLPLKKSSAKKTSTKKAMQRKDDDQTNPAENPLSGIKPGVKKKSAPKRKPKPK